MDDRIARAGKYSQIANKQFLLGNRELLASFDHKAVEDAMLAFIKLNCREEISTAEPSVSLYLQIQERAFITLFDRGAISLVAPITDLGQKALDAMRRATGIGAEALPPEPPKLTPQQALEDEILRDWKRLPTAAIHAKQSKSQAYATTLDRLAESGRLS